MKIGADAARIPGKGQPFKSRIPPKVLYSYLAAGWGRGCRGDGSMLRGQINYTTTSMPRPLLEGSIPWKPSELQAGESSTLLFARYLLHHHYHHSLIRTA